MFTTTENHLSVHNKSYRDIFIIENKLEKFWL